jgi:hypothetical protein
VKSAFCSKLLSIRLWTLLISCFVLFPGSLNLLSVSIFSQNLSKILQKSFQGTHNHRTSYFFVSKSHTKRSNSSGFCVLQLTHSRTEIRKRLHYLCCSDPYFLNEDSAVCRVINWRAWYESVLIGLSFINQIVYNLMFFWPCIIVLTCFNYQLDAQFLYSVIYVLH